MSKKYMHLDDTNFPNVEGVNPYKYHNNFDYTRWRNMVAIKLVNVKWNSDYSDVPKWNTDADRDAWFDAKEGPIRPLETLFNTTPENTVRIPIPYNDAYNYNYLVVDMPIQTGAGQPIDYEDENVRIKRWYYFINDMAQYSPNTTELKISLDYWTMFINTVDIPYLMLERGHAPMAQTSVSQFLNNPIENSEYLLANDFNFGDNTLIKHTNYYPIGNGAKYVLFAVPFSKEQFQSLVAGSTLGNSTPATFSDTDHIRWGYQFQVNGYAWNYGGHDYSNSSLPVDNISSNDGNLFNGAIVYAIQATDAKQFFTVLAEKYAYVMNAIQACFILADDMFARNDSFTFEGYTIYKCVKNTDVENIVLTKNDFEFDSRYEDITKLYTFPYSVLEITDDNGKTFEIKIENTSGNVKMRNEINIAYPYMNYNILFTGINGNGEQQYIWSEIAANKNKTIWEDDFSKYMMVWDIPTFSLFTSAEKDFAVTNYPRMQAERSGAIVDYQNAVRYADVGYENVEDSLSTQKTNAINTSTTNKNNSDMDANTTQTVNDNTATTNKENADRQANTIKENDDASTNQIKQNMDASADAAKTNADRDFDNAYDIEAINYNTRGAITDRQMRMNDEITEINNKKLRKDIALDMANIGNSMVGAVNNATMGTVSHMVSSGINAASSLGGATVAAGAAAGAAVPGAVVAGLATAAITGYSSLYITSTDVNVTNVEADNEMTRAYFVAGGVDSRGSYWYGINNEIKDATNSANYDNTLTANVAAYGTPVSIAERNKKTGKDDATLLRDTNKANNKRTNDRELANNGRTNTMQLANNSNTKDMHIDNNAVINATQLAINLATKTTIDANAQNVYDTEEPNAKWNRDSAIEAAKANLNQKQVEMAAMYQSVNLSKPVAKTLAQGDINPDLWERRGIRVNVRTQTKAAIAQAGDAMLRFGYALNRTWDMENGFNYMKHFTYWKAADVWINDGDGTAGDAVEIIQAILLAGVTIWKNADEIGTISIYDNLEYA